MITRRRMLIAAMLDRVRPLGALATTVFGGLGSAQSHGLEPSGAIGRHELSSSASSATWNLTLDFGTARLTFDESDAVDLGDYIGEFVHQQCRMVTRDNWRVFFRPDPNGARAEVVVEYGRATVGPVTHITKPYVATIARGGHVVYRGTIPRHWWGARWRWQSAERPVVRDPATLKERRWIANFGPEGLYGKPPITESLHWQGPMSALVDVDPVMASGGDHDQIGYLTEAAADYMIRPSRVTLTSLRSEGEWIANACIHLRNDDGRLLDVAGKGLRYVGDKGTIVGIPVPKHGLEPSFVYPEVAHTYPCATAGWLLTDDPYLLEEIQFMVNWSLLQYAWTEKPGLLPANETRAYAWSLRDAFVVAATTPSLTPTWMLSKRYWEAVLKRNLEYSMRFVDASARIHAMFRAWPRSDMVAGCMSAWLTAVVGMAAEMGLPGWERVFRWAVDMQIKMSDGTSGWNRERPAPDYWFPNCAKTEFMFLLGPSSDATVCKDWADAWNYFSSGSDGRTATLDTSSWDGYSFLSANAIYQPHLRSALAIAVDAGITGARPCYNYVNEECSAANRRYGLYGHARFSIDPREGHVPLAAVVARQTEDSGTEDAAAWVPEPGCYADIPMHNKANDVMPSFYPRDADPIFVNWSGAAYVPEFSDFGALVYEGGGHGVVRDGKLILDLTTLRWSFANAASRAWPEMETDQYGMRPDGAAYSPHTYHGVQHYPTAWGGGARGSVVRCFIPGSKLKNAVWVADISKPILGWTRIVDAMVTSVNHDTGSYPVTAIDEARKGWWIGTYAASDRIIFLGCDSAQRQYPVGLNTNGSHFARDPIRDVLVRIDDTDVTAPLRMWELDCANPTAWQAIPLFLDGSVSSREALPGYGPNVYNRSAPYRNYFARSGLEWSTILKCFVLFEDSGNPNVWVFTHERDHYLVRLETLTPAPGTNFVAYAVDHNHQPLHNGNWGKFREVPLLSCFVWAAAGGRRPQAFRLSAM